MWLRRGVHGPGETPSVAHQGAPGYPCHNRDPKKHYAFLEKKHVKKKVTFLPGHTKLLIDPAIDVIVKIFISIPTFKFKKMR